MARFGIETDNAFGVSMPDIRAIAKEIEPGHELAEALWQSSFHEAGILASLVDRPKWVTPEQMDRWTKDFNSWDVCDQVCGNLWDRTPYCDEKIYLWAGDEREFVRPPPSPPLPGAPSTTKRPMTRPSCHTCN